MRVLVFALLFSSVSWDLSPLRNHTPGRYKFRNLCRQNSCCTSGARRGWKTETHKPGRSKSFLFSRPTSENGFDEPEQPKDEYEGENDGGARRNIEPVGKQEPRDGPDKGKNRG